MALRTPFLVGLVLVAVVGVAGAWLARERIALAIVARAYDRAMRPDPLDGLPDGLSVGLCGAGSPMPDPTRAGPCEVVVAGRRIFVIDSGEGSAKVLALMNLPPADVSAVFLTHFHSDHIADLGELMLQHWAGGAASRPLPIYGPEGVGQVVGGFEQAYALDRGYRIAHHGPKVVPPSGFGGEVHEFSLGSPPGEVRLVDEPDLTVLAFPVDHGPVRPAVGYLFVYKGRRVVVSGDTAPSPTLEAAARGADILVHEGLSPAMVATQRAAALKYGRANLASILHDILSYHTTPEQAAAIAARDHVRMLLFTHIIPPAPMDALNGVFLGRAPKLYSGPIRVGRDGDFFTVLTHDGEIRRSNRLRSLL